jgi:hypothetical protein
VGRIFVADRARSDRKSTEERLADASLDGTLDAWPAPPPRPPKTALDRTRLELIATPGQVHRLGWKLHDVGRASKLASTFRRAKPSTLDPTATGTFDARAYYDPDDRTWRIAARYLPASETSPSGAPGEP